jgi:micrococcal nuclease
MAATLSLADHLFGRGNDWANLDGATATVAGVVDASAVRVTLPNGRSDIVRLVGIDAPQAPENPQDTDWSAAAVSWLGRNFVGRVVTLRLEPTQTRDSRGELLASIYPGQWRDLDLQSVNQQLIAAGLAFASQTDPCQFHAALRRAESEARRQSLGLWSQTVLGHIPKARAARPRPAAN